MSEHDAHTSRQYKEDLDCIIGQCNKAEARIKELEAERDKLKADAERWKRTINGDVYIEWHEGTIYVACKNDGTYFTSQAEAEAYIDAEMEEEP